MLDIIVIGRPGFKSTDKPQVIYCGDSRSEAKQAALSSSFAWVYEVNGMISRNYRTQRSKVAAAETPLPETVETESPKKKKSNK